MPHEYFPLRYRCNNSERWLLWFSEEEDGVVTDGHGAVPSFHSLAALEAYACSRGFVPGEAPALLHDLDKTEAWIEGRSAPAIDCENLLCAWNLFADVSRSVAGDFDADPAATDALYERLFFGSDAANHVLRPSDAPGFIPRFTERESDVIRATMAAGLVMFRRVVRPVDSAEPRIG